MTNESTERSRRSTSAELDMAVIAVLEVLEERGLSLAEIAVVAAHLSGVAIGGLGEHEPGTCGADPLIEFAAATIAQAARSETRLLDRELVDGFLQSKDGSHTTEAGA